MPFPLVFCAPTLSRARLAAWKFIAGQKPGPLDPPLILGRHAGASAWRDLARAGAPGHALVLPRLATPDWYFARAHSANARQKFWGGLNRLWTLAKTLRGIENRLELLDFDADDTDALREMAELIALLRRQNLPALPASDDPYGRELEQWRSAYEEELQRIDAFDFEAAPALFGASAKSNRAFLWPHILGVDDVGEPSPALEAGLAALFSRAGCVVGTMAIPGGWDEPIAGRARAFWTRHGAQFIEENDDSPRTHVARQLLDPIQASAASTALPPDVWLTPAHTTGDEAGRVAAFIRREIEGGAQARDFCLLVPDPATQERPLRAAFEAAGVPLDWPFPGAAGSPLFERLVRLLVPRAVRGVDELHDLLGDGALRLEWSGNDGQRKRLDAGRLRRAHRLVRGEEEGAAWRDAELLARDWEARLARWRASDAGRGDQTRAQILSSSLDGGDLQGVARLKALLAPLSEPLTARDWESAALAVADVLAAHWDEAPLALNSASSQETRADGAPSTSNTGSPILQAGQPDTSGEDLPGHTRPSGVTAPNIPRLDAGGQLSGAPGALDGSALASGAMPGSAMPDSATGETALGRDIAQSAMITRSALPQDEMALGRDIAPAGVSLSSDENPARSSARAQTAWHARAALDAFRGGVRAVAARAGDETGARSSGVWTAWLRLESGARNDDGHRERGAGVRVLRVGEESEAATKATRGAFVVGLSERAWPKQRPVSSWPRATALGLETLRAGEAPPLSLALHGFARLLALPCPLFLSRAAWSEGTENGASPLWEDLSALFPGAVWPHLPRAEDAAVPCSRSHWLQMLARSRAAHGQRGEEIEREMVVATRPVESHEPVSPTFNESPGDKAQDNQPAHRRAPAVPPQSAPQARADAAKTTSVSTEPVGLGSNSSFIEDPELSVRLGALDAMRRGRASLDELGRYDGVLGERGQTLLRPLLAREDERLVVSPSGIEGYARCPIRFFFERVLQVPGEDGTEDDLSRAESGDLVHRVLHTFRRDWKTPLGMNSFEAAREFLSHLTRRECDSLGLPPILRCAEARRLIGTLPRPGALVRLLRAECLEADAQGRGVWAQTLHPLLHLAAGAIEGAGADSFSLAPGGNGLEQAFRLPLTNALVQGRIDRIDASSDGSLVVVVDYKTGSAAALPSFAKGSDRLGFQLAVYLLAAGELVREWKSAPQIAASYLSPRAGFAGWTAAPGALGETTKGAMKGDVLEQWLADSRVQIERIASLIEAGTFNLSLRPAKIARCEGCACRALCGQNAQRQSARAGVHLGSNVVFLPERIEWK